MKERLYLFDTTLRDGAQTLGVDFSVEDKRVIAERLDALGIDYVEAGYPGANPVDTAFFEAPPQLNAKLTAFGMTKRAGRSTSNDPGFQAVVQAAADAVCLVASPGIIMLRWRSASAARKTSKPSPPRWRRCGCEARAAHRLRAFLRRLQGQPRLRAGLRENRV